MKNTVREYLFGHTKKTDTPLVDRLEGWGVFKEDPNIGWPKRVPSDLLEILKVSQSDWVFNLKQRVDQLESHNPEQVERLGEIGKINSKSLECLRFDNWTKEKAITDIRIRSNELFESLYPGRFFCSEVFDHTLNMCGLGCVTLLKKSIGIPDINLDEILKFRFRHEDSQIDIEKGTTVVKYSNTYTSVGYVDYRVVIPYFNSREWEPRFRAYSYTIKNEPNFSELGSCYVFIPVGTKEMRDAGYVLVTSWDQE